MKKKRLVLVVSSDSDLSDELSRAIATRGIGNVEMRYATDLREAQRAVRAERFTAVVTLDEGYLDFCTALVPELTTHGSWLDVIIAKADAFDSDMSPYGVLLFYNMSQVALEVLKAINHQNGLEAERRAIAIAARGNN